MGGVESKIDGGVRFADDFLERGHKRLDRTLCRHFSSGVKYNSSAPLRVWHLAVKIVIRGECATGKSTLLRMLQAASSSVGVAGGVSPILFWLPGGDRDRARVEAQTREYTPTRQIQVANLRWKYRDTDDVIKVEVWDVVDHGHAIGSRRRDLHTINAHPVAAAPPPANTHAGIAGVLDAASINVYTHSNGVIFLFDVSKPATIDYVAKQLAEVPRDLPVLIIGSFADKTTAHDDGSFISRRFEAIRGEKSPAAPLHYISGSLIAPSCPANPPSGLVPAILKFFELPFLQLQHHVLTARLKINEEQVAKARAEWQSFLAPPLPKSHISTPNMIPASGLAQPETTHTHDDLARQSGALRHLDTLSTDTLTLASRKAWSDQQQPICQRENESESESESWFLANKRTS